MRDQGIEVIVCKNSGGTASYAKIAAAHRLGLPVVIVTRPPVPEGVETVATVDEAAAWRFLVPQGCDD